MFENDDNCLGVARSEQAKTRLSNKIRLEHELRPLCKPAKIAAILAGLHSGVTQAVNVSLTYNCNVYNFVDSSCMHVYTHVCSIIPQSDLHLYGYAWT